MAIHGFKGSEAQSEKTPVSTQSESTVAARLGEPARVEETAAVDIVEIARECRKTLVAEIAEIDEFIRMADALIDYRQRLNIDALVVADTSSATTEVANGGVDAEVISDEVKAQDDLAAVATVVDTDPVDDEVLVLFSDSAHQRSEETASTTNRTPIVAPDAQPPVNTDKLRAVDTLPSDAGRVDVQIGQRLRQRRWMTGMSKQQLADTLGVSSAEIRRYEMGASRISTASMLSIATAMEVPVSYFFEGLDGQVADTDEARTTILSDEEAIKLVRTAPIARNA